MSGSIWTPGCHGVQIHHHHWSTQTLHLQSPAGKSLEYLELELRLLHHHSLETGLVWPPLVMALHVIIPYLDTHTITQNVQFSRKKILELFRAISSKILSNKIKICFHMKNIKISASMLWRLATIEALVCNTAIFDWHHTLSYKFTIGPKYWMHTLLSQYYNWNI